MSSLIFLNTFAFFKTFLIFFKIPYSKKIQGYDETVSSISRKILEQESGG